MGIGVPRDGLYLREDVDLRCNIIMIGFVKRTLKRAHSTLVDRLVERSHIKERVKVNDRLGYSQSVHSGSRNPSYAPSMHSVYSAATTSHSGAGPPLPPPPGGYSRDSLQSQAGRPVSDGNVYSQPAIGSPDFSQQQHQHQFQQQQQFQHQLQPHPPPPHQQQHPQQLQQSPPMMYDPYRSSAPGPPPPAFSELPAEMATPTTTTKTSIVPGDDAKRPPQAHIAEMEG